LKAVLAGHGDDVTMSVFHPVKELIATASRDYFVRVYDFDARLVSKFGGSASHVVWLDWTEDGRHLVALNDDGTMARWPWAATQPIDAIGPGSDEHRDYAPAAPNSGSSCAGAHGKRVVIDARKSLLACVSDGALGVWDISTPTPVPVVATILPDDVWARSCAFAGLSRLVFRTLGAGYRIYDYLRDEWQAGHNAPANGANAVRFCGNDSPRP
jgi:toxoflavin biosynthesis protein ToxC